MSQNNDKEKEEELINNLEAYIDCLKDTSESFNQIKNPTISDREEFFNDYINLEDNILSTFAVIKTTDSEKINELLMQFNKYWTEYQDTWSEDYWYQYETLRKSRDKSLCNGIVSPRNNMNNNLIHMNSLNMDTSSNNINRSVLRSSTLNLYNDLKVTKKEETLSKIDEELKNVDEQKKENPEKKRGCVDCNLF